MKGYTGLGTKNRPNHGLATNYHNPSCILEFGIPVCSAAGAENRAPIPGTGALPRPPAICGIPRTRDNSLGGQIDPTALSKLSVMLPVYRTFGRAGGYFHIDI